MKRYALPLVLFSAIGAIVVILVLGMDDKRGGVTTNPFRNQESGSTGTGGTDTTTADGPQPARTTTSLEKNRWMREFERSLDREDLSNAQHYRSRVAESMHAIMADKELQANLVATIRKHAVEERDPAKRRILLPLLRVFATPETTAIVEQEYYAAESEWERLVLLEAMSSRKHNPTVASEWALDMALHSEDPQHRALAFQYMQDNPASHEAVFQMAEQLYQSSTRPAQRLAALEEVARRAALDHEPARAMVRRILANPRPEELSRAMSEMEVWATEKDARRLEVLAQEFPDMEGLILNEVERIRIRIRMEEEHKRDGTR
ncbi:MAG: hypothetical protein AAGD14_08320 [Planctomycetota bacterium]